MTGNKNKRIKLWKKQRKSWLRTFSSSSSLTLHSWAGKERCKEQEQKRMERGSERKEGSHPLPFTFCSSFSHLVWRIIHPCFTSVSSHSSVFFFNLLLLSSGYISHTIPPFSPSLSSLLSNFCLFITPATFPLPECDLFTSRIPPFLLYSPHFSSTPFTVLHRGIPGALVFSPHPSFLLLFLAAVLLLSLRYCPLLSSLSLSQRSLNNVHIHLASSAERLL